MRKTNKLKTQNHKALKKKQKIIGTIHETLFVRVIKKGMPL
jgi:hypothetical protein